MAVYIQVDVHLRYHRRTKRLAQLLGVTPREAMSYLVCLWSTAATEAEDGVLAGWDDREIACASDYDGGQADRFVKALLDSGWLEGDRTLHGWQNHYGRTLQARAKSRERWRAWEERQKNPARWRRAGGVLAARRRRVCGALAAPLPFPFPSSPPTTPSSSLSQSYSQEEQTSASQMFPPSDSENRSEAAERAFCAHQEAKRPIIAIPIVSSKDDPTQGEFLIYREQVDEWNGLFPAVDVEQELREMRAWCLASPERRKTRRGVLRFVTGWLSREQDRARTWNGPRSVPADPRRDLPSPASSKSAEEAIRKVGEWAKDREQHPEEYVSGSEIKSILGAVGKIGRA